MSILNSAISLHIYKSVDIIAKGAVQSRLVIKSKDFLLQKEKRDNV